MDNLTKLTTFLDELSEKKIFFKLDKIRDSILVEISVPGEKWEVEFMLNGDIEIEKYISTGVIGDEKELDDFWERFSD